MKEVLDSGQLENYLCSIANDGTSGFLPKGSADIRVVDLKKLAGRTNNLYTFCLDYVVNGSKLSGAFVLKGYLENAWDRARALDDCKIYVRETEVLRSLSSINFPAPKVFFCEPNSVHLGYPFVVMEKLDDLHNSNATPELVASALTKIHGLDLASLNIKTCSSPKGRSDYAVNWAVRFRRLLDSDRSFARVSRVFGRAARWVEDNAVNALCERYSLVHGDFHVGNIMLTKASGVNIIDWEQAEIGDPAFDVAYAYHMFILTGDPKKKNLCEMDAKRFLKEYNKRSGVEVIKSLEFYKVVTSLALALAVTSWISNPLIACGHYGFRGGFRELSLLYFPFKKTFVSELSFSARIVRYFEENFESILNK